MRARAAKLAAVVAFFSILLLTALGYLAGPPYGLSDGSTADALAGVLFVAHLAPGLVASLFARSLSFTTEAAQFVALGVLWAVLSAVQWRVVGYLLRRRESVGRR